MASSPSGLQVPVLLKSSEPRSYSTSRGSWPGPCLCSVACPCRGHLASRLASTVRRLWRLDDADISHFNCKASWWHPSVSRCVLRSGHAHPASPDLPSTSRVSQYRIKPHQMVTVHACTWGGCGFSRCGCGAVEPGLYYTRAEPKIDEGNRHISKPWPRPSQAKAKTDVGALASQALFLKEAKAALSQTKAPASAFHTQPENPYMILVH